MTAPDHLSDCRDGEPLLPIEHLLTEDERRPLTVEEHHQFRQDMATRLEQLEEAAHTIDPYVSGTSNSRSEKELNRMLDLIDNLPISTNGTDGQA